jgi:hypothetical protein
MLAVVPACRGRGLAAQLKLEQRRLALEQGIRTIHWTYDPLELVNGTLNIRRLGGIARTYVRELYGSMRDGLNAGLPSDRLVFRANVDARTAAVADTAVRALRRHLPPVPELATATLHPPEETPTDAEVLVAMVGSLLLFTSLAVYGQWVVAGVVEEKNNRVVELILATMRSRHLLAGKVIGIGLVGLVQLALIAGMMPVAIGLGEGGEFYRPLAVAIIGGTITSTMLTLLVVPTFYDSIEIAHDRMLAKFHRRAERWNPFYAFVLTFVEAILTLVLVRMVYRAIRKLVLKMFGGRRPPASPPVVHEQPVPGVSGD